jgi:hypothetical protein
MQGFEYSARVGFAWSYPNVEILCVSGLGVLHESVRADNQVLHFMGVESAQQIFEV